MLPQTKTLEIAAAWIGVVIVALFFFALSPAVFGYTLMFLGLGMAVTANQIVRRQEGCKKKQPVAASTTIYEGTLVFSNATGYADDDTASGVNRFAGVAVDQVDNSSGSAGDKSVELWTDGTFLLTGSGFTQASVGLKAYATDNYVITTSAAAANAVYIGVVKEYVSTTTVRVAIDVVDDRQDGGSIAAAGSAQGDATQLLYGMNSVSAADGTKGVLLPPVSAGKRVLVYNEHATNGLKIYPATGEDINDGTANAAITSEGKTLAMFYGVDATTWGATYTANS